MNESDLSDLVKILSIPSISTLSENKSDIGRCVEWLRSYMNMIGLRNVQSFKTPGNPIVYSEYIISKTLPTLLVYGHYDVQPADPISEWKSDPFTPTIRDGKLYARGSADDKGQFMLYLFAFADLMKQSQKFPINIKFIIEGEEETGSENLEDFIKTHKDLLKADFAFISDSHMISETQPAIDYGLRGLVYFQIDLRTAEHDAHSGIYGGAIRNPIIDLAHIISKLKNESGKILVNGIYENVRNVDDTERFMIKEQMSDDSVKSEVGSKITFGESDFSIAERTGARPSLDVHGIWGGFTGEGSKTVIPSKASCKVSIRIVPNQTVEEVKQKFINYIESLKPEGVDMQVTFLTGGEPYLLDYRKPIMQIASDVLKNVFGNTPQFLLSGGSIPVTEVLKTNLGIDTVLLGFGLPDDNLHAPNEKINLVQLENGKRAIKEIFIALGSKSLDQLK